MVDVSNVGAVQVEFEYPLVVVCQDSLMFLLQAPPFQF